MTYKITLGAMVAAALLAGCAQQPATMQAAAQPARKVAPCNFAWCPIYVQVTQDAAGATVAVLQWDELRMLKKYPGATVTWELQGSPDYEFRSGSIVATGPNAANAATEFPVRQISANRYALDNLNNNDLSYTYDVRVYRKGSPIGSTPVVLSGTIANSYN